VPLRDVPNSNHTTRRSEDTMTDTFRARADVLGSRRGGFGFHSKTALEESPAALRLVAQAVARAKEGDREAVRFLYLQYADNVYGYVRSIVRDDFEAEDVTQQVFAKLMTAIGKYQERDVSFSAWIMRVARNVAVDHLRRRRAIPCEEVRELEPGADEDASRNRSLMLRDALAALPEEQREVIVLRHLVGLSPGEIAGRLGRTEPSIHGLHHRGRGALRSALTEMQCGPTVGGQAAA
jgi:RNA polymerase sigma-70 factor (ECF subfamily)